jgi:uncharacterized protein
MAKLLISPIYVGLFAILLVLFSLNVSRVRAKLKINLGDNNDPTMLQACRIHGNFAEYVPLALLVIVLVEGAGNAGWVVHLLGLALLLGRILHAWGINQTPGISFGRAAGMGLTYLVLLIGGVIAILAGWSIRI